VVGAVQGPHERGVAEAVPPVLREVVGEQEDGQHLPPGPSGPRRPAAGACSQAQRAVDAASTARERTGNSRVTARSRRLSSRVASRGKRRRCSSSARAKASEHRGDCRAPGRSVAAWVELIRAGWRSGRGVGAVSLGAKLR
jgi:hypothetical protein